jgi:hypothetical protein
LLGEIAAQEVAQARVVVDNQNIGGAGGYVLHHAAMIKQAL